MFIISLITLLLSFLFFLFNHPLMMILCLIFITLSVSLNISSILTYPWFSYILILIFLGAMLIIFLYMASIAPNELLVWNWKPLILSSTMLVPILFMNHSQMKSSFHSSSFLFSKFPSMITITTAIYLLLTMIAIVKITSLPKGPMKSN